MACWPASTIRQGLKANLSESPKWLHSSVCCPRGETKLQQQPQNSCVFGFLPPSKDFEKLAGSEGRTPQFGTKTEAGAYWSKKSLYVVLAQSPLESLHVS